MNPARNLENEVEVILVLGTGKIESRRRVEYAYELARQSEIPIIVSGLTKRFDGEFSEAEYMANILKQKGIRQERIIKENKAYNTETNFLYSKEPIKNLGARKIGIVTGKMHMYRARRLARKVFGNNYDLIFYPIKPRSLKDFCIEAITLINEMLSSLKLKNSSQV